METNISYFKCPLGYNVSPANVDLNGLETVNLCLINCLALKLSNDRIMPLSIATPCFDREE